jgi:hypothetical protein
MILILFYGDNFWTAVLEQMKFGTVNVHGHSYKFYLIYYFVWLNFKYGDDAKFCGYVWTKAEKTRVEFCIFYSVTS